MFRIAALAIICVGLAGAQSTGSIAVTGDITSPLKLKAEDLAAMPREKVIIPDQDGTKVEYEGVALREILKKAGAPLGTQLRGSALTTYVIAKASDGYQVVFTLIRRN